MMGEGKGSTLVHILAIALCLTASGFAIAAERRRSTGTTQTDNFNATYCVYDSMWLLVMELVLSCFFCQASHYL
ncbi:hypothetical protein Cni_G02164 [Canna indica]|uniref:Uncharacterized protein n=1 Tax=Canna indica TaxID=4628 RepID=A0AAQ3JPJ8_9LILI|nr:hypothetical protein Cni_G02164 [Canna indica]